MFLMTSSASIPMLEVNADVEEGAHLLLDEHELFAVRAHDNQGDCIALCKEPVARAKRLLAHVYNDLSCGVFIVELIDAGDQWVCDQGEILPKDRLRVLGEVVAIIRE